MQATTQRRQPISQHTCASSTHVGLVGNGSMAVAQSGGTFTPTSAMTTARSDHSATLLPNGQVLMAGGASINSGDNVLASAELYDPGDGRFHAASKMTTPRRMHTAILLPDKRVLIAGGYGNDGSARWRARSSSIRWPARSARPAT
jgi:hypothetical protein